MKKQTLDTIDTKSNSKSQEKTQNQVPVFFQEVHHFYVEMSFTSITSSISDYWESSAPAANLNPKSRISGFFSSFKRIILCIHYRHGGLLNLHQSKKSGSLPYAFLTIKKLNVQEPKSSKRTILFQGNGCYPQ